MGKWMDCSIIPDSYLTFKVALQTLNNKAGEAAQLVLLAGNKNGLLASAIKNIANPSDKNGALPIRNSKAHYYVGYDKIPDPNSLIGSLNDKENSLTISITGESYGSEQVLLQMENKSSFVIPILNLLSIIVDHESIMDMDSLKTNEMNLGRNPTSMPEDSNVYIVPICKHHNSINLPHKNTLGQNITPGNGNGFFMSIGEDTTVIKLKGYFKAQSEINTKRGQ